MGAIQSKPGLQKFLLASVVFVAFIGLIYFFAENGTRTEFDNVIDMMKSDENDPV
jgi:hypothetical protein